MRSSETKEQAIIRLHLEGKSNNAIRNLLGTRSQKIKEVIEQYISNSIIPKPKKRGRPPIPDNILTKIIAYTTENRCSSCEAVSQQLKTLNNIQISATTVWRRRKALGFEYKPPKVRQKLNLKQIEDRIDFAHSLLNANWNFDNLIFSDESRFCLTPDNACIWYRKGEKDCNIFTDKEKFKESIMVYAAIGKGYKSKLVFCESNIDAMEYRSIIEQSNMEKELNQRCGAGNYVFMQDGAPAHSSHITSLYLQKRFTYISSWPANSPDLNPIEHLWGAIKRILKTKRVGSRTELVRIVQEIWDAFPQESIDSLVESFATRLRMVVAVGGESISDILRNGLQFDVDYIQIHPQAIKPLFHFIRRYDPTINDTTPEVLSKRSWTPEEVELLIQQVRILGNKWTVIARRFRDRTPGSLKAKYQALLRQ